MNKFYYQYDNNLYALVRYFQLLLSRADVTIITDLLAVKHQVLDAVLPLVIFSEDVGRNFVQTRHLDRMRPWAPGLCLSHPPTCITSHVLSLSLSK